MTDTTMECKGDLTLGTGCKKCTRCRDRAMELAERWLAREKEDNSPDVKRNAYVMEQSGALMAHAFKLAQGDLVHAQTILKIATSGAETIMQMESVRAMMSNVMKGSRS